VTVGLEPPSISLPQRKARGSNIEKAAGRMRFVTRADDLTQIIAEHEFSLRAYAAQLLPRVQAIGTGERKHEQLVGRQTDPFDHAFRGEKKLGT
jgi:hypothetical protein